MIGYNVPALGVARYRRGDNPPTVVVYDPARVPDPLAWLRERLGDDVVLLDTDIDVLDDLEPRR